jgi:hypothetical protein
MLGCPGIVTQTLQFRVEQFNDVVASLNQEVVVGRDFTYGPAEHAENHPNDVGHRDTLSMGHVIDIGVLGIGQVEVEPCHRDPLPYAGRPRG